MENTILFLASDYNIGLSFTLADQAKSLAKFLGPNLICLSGEGEQVKGLSHEYEKNNIDLRRINGLDEHKNFLKLCNCINKIINNENILIVHVHNNWQLALFSYIKYVKRQKIKIIYTIHGYRHNSVFRAFIAKHIIGFGLYLFADVVLASSTQLKRAIPFISRKCILLYQGVDPRIAEISRDKNFGDSLQITVVGQFRVGKNQKLILEALNEYSKKTQDLNFVLNFAGSGPLLDSVKFHASKMAIAKNVIFHGQLNREDIIKLYESTDVSIIATNNETFGFCIVEPFVAEIPIFSRCTGIALDIVNHGKNGFVFDKDEELVYLLLEYLRNTNVLDKISEELKNQKDKFYWDTINLRYLRIIEELTYKHND
jgi:glycosyltransferase involved in cell wall biosynthesis